MGGSASSASESAVVEQTEPFFGESEKDVVLRREVAVDRRRTVFDPFGDLADGDVLIPLADEELARGVENGAANRLAVTFVSFFNAHIKQCSLD